MVTMSDIYKILFFSCFFIFMFSSQSQELKTADAKGPYTFAVGADPQLFMKQKDDAYWQKTTDKILKIKPDFLIVCGDLTNAGCTAHLGQAKLFVSILIGFTVFFT